MTDPVVVAGGGPVGLAAAAELAERGLEVVVYERGAKAGAAVAEWGHVRLFSAWPELVAPAARRLLEPTGWTPPPPDVYPTGAEWVRDYLAPLAAALRDRVRTGVEVVGAARTGRDRMVDDGRDSQPLTVHVRHADGREERVRAGGLVDASGTWTAPNPLGGDGLPALGERAAAAAGRLTYRIPRTAPGGHVVVAGSGHSALTALVSLTRHNSDTTVTWILRRGGIGDTFGGGDADELPARGRLGRQARAAVEAGGVRVVTGFRTAAVEAGADGRLTLTSEDGRTVDAVDHVVALTGLRPDLSWLSELRLELDPALQAPTRLAPLIDPNVHSCGSVPPHGVRELAHPESGVYLAGMKSYGRAPTFLALTGYEQVRSIAAAFAGDHAAAERVELVLPESGVCGGSGGFDGDGAGGCCGAAATAEPELLQLSSPARVPSGRS
ncbi:FAD-dependent oxidoreductase [Jiangella alkaliphila]|uniref:Pyridine nucleotide-disulphide oxidoreductase n=1 Tax=Jiangella alkaliphila TaxID=419479 RepID=A0A1H2KY17_9ACTN|nr:FAD-dependent oxidoreductase [Jiangella alkaliphila]SDU73251.1 Pyridine nucleotide-disulphide oxidoreductase [Jiangella alkaliphila]